MDSPINRQVIFPQTQYTKKIYASLEFHASNMFLKQGQAHQDAGKPIILQQVSSVIGMSFFFYIPREAESVTSKDGLS